MDEPADHGSANSQYAAGYPSVRPDCIVFVTECRNGWTISIDTIGDAGAARTVAFYSADADALDAARHLASVRRAILLIQTQDGHVQYFPPPGSSIAVNVLTT